MSESNLIETPTLNRNLIFLSIIVGDLLVIFYLIHLKASI
jgi:hypothetical protein